MTAQHAIIIAGAITAVLVILAVREANRAEKAHQARMAASRLADLQATRGRR